MCQICCRKLRKANETWSRKKNDNDFKFAYAQEKLTEKRVSKRNGKLAHTYRQIYLRNKININIDITTLA